MDQESEKENPLKQIRTFQGDVAQALENQRESLVSIQRAEQLKQTLSGSKGLSKTNKKRLEIFYLFLGSVVLLVLGSVGAWYGYQEFARRSSTPIAAASPNRFISNDNEVNLNLANVSREALLGILAEATVSVPSGELRHINLREGPGADSPLLTTAQFLERLESRAPGNLVRAFDPLFMFGTFGGNLGTEGISTFLIIKLTSFENAYAGMLAWEQNLPQDIGPLFATNRLLNNLSPEATFTDLIDRNKDVRVVSYQDQPVLLYSFFDNNMLIITDHIETLRALIDRLTREKLSR